MLTLPMPSKCPGWYVAANEGPRGGFTSDPNQAKRIPAVHCTCCDTVHPEPEGSCLL